jgi:hypothetical protein
MQLHPITRRTTLSSELIRLEDGKVVEVPQGTVVETTGKDWEGQKVYRIINNSENVNR